MKPVWLMLCASALLMSGARSNEAETHLGQWLGTWQSGDTSGRFDLDLGHTGDGELAGNIDVSTNGAAEHEYAVDLRHVNLEGDHFTALFVTPGKSAEVIRLSGILEKDRGNGEWVAHPRRDASEPSTNTSASGTWELTKHDR